MQGGGPWEKAFPPPSLPVRLFIPVYLHPSPQPFVSWLLTHPSLAVSRFPSLTLDSHNFFLSPPSPLPSFSLSLNSPSYSLSPFLSLSFSPVSLYSFSLKPPFYCLSLSLTHSLFLCLSHFSVLCSCVCVCVCVCVSLSPNLFSSSLRCPSPPPHTDPRPGTQRTPLFPVHIFPAMISSDAHNPCPSLGRQAGRGFSSHCREGWSEAPEER